METAIVNNIFSVTEESFPHLAIEVFRFQYQHNVVYHNWVNALGINRDKVNQLTDIPFLPVSLFKSHKVVTGLFEPQQIFESSGTTGTANSQHLVKDLSVYTKSFTKGFELFYGTPAKWCIIGLLPAYLERDRKSVV